MAKLTNGQKDMLRQKLNQLKPMGEHLSSINTSNDSFDNIIKECYRMQAIEINKLNKDYFKK